MNERKELIARLRECHATTHTRALIDAAADMLEADVPEVGFGNMPAVPQEPVTWDTVYKAVSAATEACAQATGMHRQIRLFVSKTQITNDALVTDTTPQPQLPRLTDEEITVIGNHYTDTTCSMTWDVWPAFARAIEKKVRGEA